MKTATQHFIAAICFAGLLATAVAQPQPDNGPQPTPPEPAPADAGNPPVVTPDAPDTPGSPDAVAAAVAAVLAAQGETPTNNAPGGTVILPTEVLGSSRDAVKSEFVPPVTGTNMNELRMNFRNAPLEMVLNYLSDAAGFIIVLDTQVRGNVSVISSHPMTQAEAVDLLNSVLNKNGYAAIQDGRTLTIVSKADAKTRDIPVKVDNDPKNIPKNDVIVTQIIPIRFVDAEQLMKDLSPFVSSQATIVANTAGNSILITDTQANIRHLVEIIRAVDNSAEAETEIRVFALKHANPTDVAAELASIFPSGGSGSTAQAPTRFNAGGRGGGSPFGGGGPGGMFAAMMGGGGNSTSSNDRIKKATQVTAVADARIQSVIVSAPKDLMEEIAGMMKDLDVESDRDQKTYVFQLKNGDPQQVAQVLQSMFQSSSSSRTSTSSSDSSALDTRRKNATTSMGTTSSTGIGGTSTGGGGGGGGRQGF